MLKLKEFREKRGLTQQDLAELLGIHKRTVSRYERNLIKLDEDNIVKICIVLDITPNELMGYMKKYKNFTDYLESLKGE